MTASLIEGQFALAEHIRRIHHATLPVGVSFDDALDPEFWANVSKQMAKGDRVEIYAVDGSFYGVVLVRDAGRGWAKVHKLEYHEITPPVAKKVAKPGAEGAGEEDFTVEWGTPKTKYRVVRKSDKTVPQDGFATIEDAQKWLQEHLAGLAA